MRVLVTGATGQLGYDVMKVLTARHIECRGIGSKELDITDYKAVDSYISTYRPDVVIHCAAYTAVDRAENDSDRCMAVNVDGTVNIARACKAVRAKLVYISTDYVFNGDGIAPFGIDDRKQPLNIYGLSKYLGEQAVQAVMKKYFIVRISWVFGKNGNNFVKTMLRLGKEKNELNVVMDQYGAPTYTADLALLLCDMITTEKYGIYHASNEGVTDWANFASTIFKTAGIDCMVHPISSDQYPTKAMRPKNSRLSKISLDKAGFQRLPDWQDALERYIGDLRSVEL